MNHDRLPVSVVLCTYNGAQYIDTQIRSLLSLLTASDEIIVSDDHSLDNTVEIIESIADSRIRIFRNLATLGYSTNFMIAFAHAKNNIVLFSDQDDIHSPASIFSAVNAISQGAELYIGSMLLSSEDATPYAFLGYSRDRILSRLNLPLRIYLIIMFSFGWNKAFGCAMAIKKTSYTVLCQGIRSYPAHDLLIYLYSLLYFKKIYFSSNIHLLHRIHTGNTSPLISTRTLKAKVWQRLALARFLLLPFINSRHS
jgi:glycosyltransferase involved in cell wall biosynthesis